MPASLVELRPDRRLLDHEFEGYKLNLQALSHYSHNLEAQVDRVFPDELQYSFVHAKLFALHNHLVLDQWDYAFSYYYIDDKQQVRHISFENINHTFQSRVVYDVPAHVERQSGHFNLCLSFPSSNLAVISDGTGYLHIVDTGARNRPAGRNQTWQTLHSSLIELGNNQYFIIVDSRIEEKGNCEVLHCLLQSVHQNDKHFYSVLSWVTFENKEQWEQTSFRQLQGKGIVHYAAIETSCTAIYVASDNVFKFSRDSKREINEPAKEEVSKAVIYTWLQTSEDITVTLKLNPKFDKKHLDINVTPQTIKVCYAGDTYIDGILRHKVNSELTTWNIQADGQIDILVTKDDSITWDELLEGGDPKGEQILDPSLVEEMHKRLAHLCSETEVLGDPPVPLSTQELEECDAPSEEDTVLVRLDATNHETTHRIPLSVHQFLFNVRIETQEVPALVLKQDVDACIWQPYAQLINSTWPVKHQGTLMAFGYVQSSKQNRKFIACPPNFAYSVVCEASRHVFIYQSANSQECQLRKKTDRVMKPVKVGQQHVFNIDKYGEVLGINATNEFLFILTTNTLLAIQIQ